MTFYCKSNRLLTGPQKFIQSQSVECLETGWSIDLSTVKCVNQRNSSEPDIRKKPPVHVPTSKPTTDRPEGTTSVSMMPNATTQGYFVRLPNATTQGYLVPDTSSTPASFTGTVRSGSQALTIQALITTHTDSDTNDQRTWDVESYDGWYNNLAHPDWGATGRL